MQFDTRETFKELKDSGLQDKVADAIVSAINKSRIADLDNLATKADISEVNSEISDVRKDIANTELKLELKIADVKSELKDEINELKVTLSRIDNNIGLFKWFFIGILFPVTSAAIKYLFF
jgi:hypothetical protein